MLLEFTERDGTENFDLELTNEGHIDLKVVTSDNFTEVLSIEDGDLVRFATALLTLPRHEELTIESHPMGERVRFGEYNLVDVPRNEESANAVLERATALLASVGLYQDNAKRKAEAEAKVKAMAKEQEERAALRKALARAGHPFTTSEEVDSLLKAGVRVVSNV